MFSQVLVSAVFGAALVSAASIAIPNVSQGCSTALGNVLISPQAACLNAGALVNLALSPNTSIISVVDTWVQGMCNVPACASSDLTAIVNNVTAGCLTDINTASAAYSLPAITADQIQSAVAMYYPTARQVACLKDNSANQMCVTQTLSNIQTAVGMLSFSNALNIVQQGGQALESMAANITCTSCVQAGYVDIRTNFPAQVTQFDITTALNTVCSANFTNGDSPSTVSEVAVATKKNGAMRTSMAGGAFLVVAAVFTILA